jgi:hypothetical protein
LPDGSLATGKLAADRAGRDMLLHLRARTRLQPTGGVVQQMF